MICDEFANSRSDPVFIPCFAATTVLSGQDTCEARLNHVQIRPGALSHPFLLYAILIRASQMQFHGSDSTSGGKVPKRAIKC